jgi:hypothetical protein
MVTVGAVESRTSIEGRLMNRLNEIFAECEKVKLQLEAMKQGQCGSVAVAV